MPTSTVEDYLKCILLEEQRKRGERVSTGRIATAMGVAPGTVTAMIKTLTEAGLVEYEPYAGVRLTDSGGKLGTHVLRRHRLVELFLVKIMGMSWSEVHPEAEVLEHAVSERLIERIDAMLGHPSVDPHGDPIPSATGQVVVAEHATLLACDLNTRIRIARVTDQRCEFLELLERHHLLPGTEATLESRDDMAQTVRVRPKGAGSDDPLQLGFKAAARILVVPA